MSSSTAYSTFSSSPPAVPAQEIAIAAENNKHSPGLCVLGTGEEPRNSDIVLEDLAAEAQLWLVPIYISGQLAPHSLAGGEAGGGTQRRTS